MGCARYKVAALALALVLALVLLCALLGSQLLSAMHFRLQPECGERCGVRLLRAPAVPADVVLAVRAATQGSRRMSGTGSVQGRRTVEPQELPGYVLERLLPELCAALERELGVRAQPWRDEVFARLYEPGDFITWHYDNNFSTARRFTVVLPLMVNDANTCDVEVMDAASGEVRRMAAAVGDMLVYEGDKVYHRVTRQAQGGERLVLVAPLYEDAAFSLLGRAQHAFRTLLYRAIRI
jgi:hypothetical protein